MSIPCIDRELTEAARDAAEAIKRAKLTVVTAESCTAGLISAALSHADGASEILHGSFVTYTKDNKSKALGVDRRLLSEKSAVCAEVAEQMACGALDRSPATLALAFVRSRWFCASTIIGATTLAQLKENIDVEGVELKPEVLAEIDSIHARYPNPAI